MAIALGIVFVVLGLFFVTPLGAAVGLRWNQGHADDGLKGPGTRAKTVPGVMFTGLVFIVAGIYVIVRAA